MELSMADLDTINVCEKCLHPVERLVLCPACKASVKKTPALLLATLRTLKAKGWVVTDWECKVGQAETALKSISWDVVVKVYFWMFAPPSGSVAHPEFKDAIPCILTVSNQVHEAFRKLYQWAKDAPRFVLPFGQGLCDKCIQQGADWYFSKTRCGKGEDGFQSPRGHYHSFFKGVPDKCAYRVEQILTMDNRYDELKAKGWFVRNPIAQRTCAQWARKG